ncbi:assimilatory nitrate reductase catalytic subunit NasC [Alkalihalobacterium elongatum]|uniref:assimilatory nitrate reductase catalytic subunit NasC n=1 Tax=Alkalihalobacterium elongatum TaxID=2675466 RepID=UPI001C1F4401|nr:molybdopterin oxidoreductase family protein [Alkalihalobacterium elongatum]
MSDLIQYFREKQMKQSSEQVMKGRCPYCSMQCSMELIEEHIIERKRFKVKPNKQDPTSEGRLCIKGLQAHQHAINTERVKYPLLKIDGEWVRISWELALEMIAEKFSSLQQEYGHHSIGVYGGGSLTNEEAYLLGKFARVGLQTKYIDYNGRFCMSAAASAANATFGIDRGMTNGLTEIQDAKCIILAGTNIAECQPTIMPYFRKAKKNGAFIIAIDPRETATTKMTDLHIKVKPGTDANLAMGLLKVLVDERYCDETFIAERTKNFDEVKQQISSISLTEIANHCGISKEEIMEAARQYGKAETGMIFTARGVEQHTNGYETVRHFLNIVLATGKIGRHACGYGAITGQGNGQGGREHGQKADQLPGYRSIENDEDRKYVASVWEVDEADLPRKGVSAYELIEKIDEEEVKALFLMGSNPVVSSPNAIFVEKALEKLNFLVVVDMFVSETARMADLILPTTSYLEDEGTMTNLEGRVVYRHAERKAPKEVKHDWEILCELAKVLGKEEKFNYQNVEEIFNELRKASKGGIADYYGITYERVKDGGVFWPCPKEGHPGTTRLFEKSFHTKDGLAEFNVNKKLKEKEKITEEFPLILTTGRLMEHYLTGVQTRRSQELFERSKQPYVEIHPETAKDYGIEDDMLVRIESKRGSVLVKSKFTDRIRRDTLFVPFHWGDFQCINRVTNPALDPVCRMPEFKVSYVNINPNQLIKAKIEADKQSVVI